MCFEDRIPDQVARQASPARYKQQVITAAYTWLNNRKDGMEEVTGSRSVRGVHPDAPPSSVHTVSPWISWRLTDGGKQRSELRTEGGVPSSIPMSRYQRAGEAKVNVDVTVC
ncbi:hypothetical protein SKAU_G00311730 [Synaphobranchus kaupii]|uniref:Uncharacterized protein n=1 Tax=Synaphobranchus kaupii TaxID=118154 RepID=A0A9Q1ES01_SYNKA|nr:hypothetical protein SKAU_G00311730 [Synaphobranchus kaupii]